MTIHSVSVSVRSGVRKRVLVEVEIAKRFFYWLIFGFLQTFGKFPFQNIVLHSLRLDRQLEFRFHSFRLLTEQARGVIQIN